MKCYRLILLILTYEHITTVKREYHFLCTCILKREGSDLVINQLLTILQRVYHTHAFT